MSLGPSEWYSLGKVQYHKPHLFDMHPTFTSNLEELHNFIVECAPFAGPIAVTKNPRKLTKATKATGASTVQIYSSSGDLLSTITWDSKTVLVKMGWTDELRLLCIFQDGVVNSYSVFGDLESQFNLLPPSPDDQIVKAETWGGGIVALSSKLMFIVCTELNNPKPRVSLLADAELEKRSPEPPTCIALIEPRFTKHSSVEVLVATAEGSILVVNKNSVVDMEIAKAFGSSSPSPIVKMAIAPNGMFMAVFTMDGILTVMNTAMDSKILSFDTHSSGSKAIPTQMIWCGEDAVVLYWKRSGIITVGPFGSWMRFPYDVKTDPLVLLQEADGCRIYSPRTAELLQRVPSHLEEIRRVGSTAPGAMLLDAMEAFDAADAKADENIRSLQLDQTLVPGISQCISAACQEFDPATQRTLLRAASYGRCFAFANLNKKGGVDDDGELDDLLDPEVFVESCRELRVLNGLRSPKIGMPLTHVEYQRLTPEVVVSRLVCLRHHFLALKICDYLKISTDRVLIHWACEKVKSSENLSDEEIVGIVRDKLKSASRVSYAAIAACAEKGNRCRLATLLLDLEEQPADQIPLLLSMGEFELALKKSLQSSDTDLIYMTLLHIERTLKSIEEFKFVLLRDPAYQEAVHLMTSYYRETFSSGDKLKALLTDSNGVPTIESADYAVQLASIAAAANDVDAQIGHLKDAASKYTSAKALNHAKATEEQIDLLREQMKLEDKINRKLVGLSVSETISKLTFAGRRDPKCHQYAKGVAQRFKFPDRCYYMVKINALANSRQWDALQKFSQEKKTPPCGFKPFALACFDQGEKRQAEAFVARISNDDERFETFKYMEMWEAALEVAIKLKDPEKLSAVRNACNETRVHELVDEAAARLGFI